MPRLAVTFPEFLLGAGTRALGGLGVGLLLADQLPARQRRALGMALVLVAGATTVPLVKRIVPRVCRTGRVGRATRYEG